MENKIQFLQFSNLVSNPIVCFTLFSSHTGTTCLVALLSDRELTVANVGDSRGVLCDKDGNAVALSHDHKPYQLKERKRIKRAGTNCCNMMLMFSGMVYLGALCWFIHD